MGQDDNHLSIVFSDIVGSSRLYSCLGNQRAKEKIDEAMVVMAEIVDRFNGRVVKTIGDEIMYAHPEPEQACEAAVSMNQALKRMHFYLRTGMSFGKVINDQDDLYGDTVNHAAYLARTAQANQILLDTNIYSNAFTFRKQCEFFDRIILKGETEQSLIYRLNWELSSTASLDATMVATKAISAENGMPTQLLISYQGKSFSIESSSQVIIGRDLGTVQICVKHRNASRQHCSLSYNRGKFILEDYSTNGTYLLQEGHQEVFLRRESTPIVANGKFSIGQPCNGSDTILEYQLD